MNILIAEDEPLAAERLSQLVQQCLPEAKLVAITDSVSDTIDAMQNSMPDLLLLDIQLADGKSFRVLEETKTELPVIFTTAYDEYAIQAFQYHSIDYLLKPINKEKLSQALDKYRRLGKSQSNNEIGLLKKTLESFNKKYKQRFLVKMGQRLVFIETEKIANFYADGKTVYLIPFQENKKYIADYTLEELEQQLPPDLFFRINRKHIINIKSITEVKGNNANLEIKTANPVVQTLVVSRDRATAFKQWLDQ
ncbi:MAG: LytTR family DNA-binding domain-containing protein [Cyclobacteriaceae bacterium]|jgi:two-component system response regulator LytT|nr:LytTR family DNA-binding domain-containing protein [Cyclobacteriaceae bacterium]